jgi:hypothetical protein
MAGISVVTNADAERCQPWLNGNTLFIPEHVIRVENFGFRQLFKNNAGISAVTGGAGLIAVGQSIFGGKNESGPSPCSHLEAVDFSQSIKLKTITERLFAGCTSLRRVTLNLSVTSINACAFEGCSRLDQFLDGSAITTIGDNAFKGCSSLDGLELPALTTIGDGAFKGCASNLCIETSEEITLGKDALDGHIISGVNVLGTIGDLCDVQIGSLNFPTTALEAGDFARFLSRTGNTSIVATVENSHFSRGMQEPEHVTFQLTVIHGYAQINIIDYDVHINVLMPGTSNSKLGLKARHRTEAVADTTFNQYAMQLLCEAIYTYDKATSYETFPWETIIEASTEDAAYNWDQLASAMCAYHAGYFEPFVESALIRIAIHTTEAGLLDKCKKIVAFVYNEFVTKSGGDDALYWMEARALLFDAWVNSSTYLTEVPSEMPNLEGVLCSSVLDRDNDKRTGNCLRAGVCYDFYEGGDVLERVPMDSSNSDVKIPLPPGLSFAGFQGSSQFWANRADGLTEVGSNHRGAIPTVRHQQPDMSLNRGAARINMRLGEVYYVSANEKDLWWPCTPQESAALYHYLHEPSFALPPATYFSIDKDKDGIVFTDLRDHIPRQVLVISAATDAQKEKNPRISELRNRLRIGNKVIDILRECSSVDDVDTEINNLIRRNSTGSEGSPATGTDDTNARLDILNGEAEKASMQLQQIEADEKQLETVSIDSLPKSDQERVRNALNAITLRKDRLQQQTTARNKAIKALEQNSDGGSIESQPANGTNANLDANPSELIKMLQLFRAKCDGENTETFDALQKLTETAIETDKKLLIAITERDALRAQVNECAPLAQNSEASVKRLDVVQRELKAMRTSLKKVQAKKDELEQEIKTIKRKSGGPYSRLSADYKIALDKVKHLEALVGERSDEILHLEATIRTMDEDAAKAVAELTAASLSLDAVSLNDATYEILKNQHKSLKQELKKLREKEADMAKTIKQALKNNSELEEDKERLAALYKKWSGQLTKALAERDSESDAISALEEEKQKTKLELDSVSEKLRMGYLHFEGYRKEHEAQASELKRLQQKLSDTQTKMRAVVLELAVNDRVLVEDNFDDIASALMQDAMVLKANLSRSREEYDLAVRRVDELQKGESSMRSSGNDELLQLQRYSTSKRECYEILLREYEDYKQKAQNQIKALEKAKHDTAETLFTEQVLPILRELYSILISKRIAPNEGPLTLDAFVRLTHTLSKKLSNAQKSKTKTKAKLKELEELRAAAIKSGAEIGDLELEMTVLRAQLVDEQAKNRACAAKLLECKEEAETAKAGFDYELEAADAAKIKKEEEVKTLAKDHVQALQDLARWEGRTNETIKGFEKREAEYRAEIEAAEKRKAELEDSVLTFQTSNKGLRKLLTKQNKELADWRAAWDNLMAHKNKIMTRSRAKVTKLEGIILSVNTKLEDAVKELDKTKTNAAELTAAHKKITELQKTIAELDDHDFNGGDNVLANAASISPAKFAGQLKKRMSDRIKEKEQEMQKKIDETENAARRELGEKDVEIQRLTASKNALLSNIASLKTANDNRQKKFAETKAALEQEMENLRNRLAAAEEAESAVTAKNTAQQKEDQKAIEDIQYEFEAFKIASENATTTKVQQAVDDAEGRYKSELKEVVTGNQILSEAVDKIKEQLAERTLELKESRETTEAAMQRCTKWEKDASTAQNALSIAQANSAFLKATLDEARRPQPGQGADAMQLEIKTAANQKLQADVRRLQISNEQTLEEFAAIQAQNNRLQVKIDENDKALMLADTAKKDMEDRVSQVDGICVAPDFEMYSWVQERYNNSEESLKTATSWSKLTAKYYMTYRVLANVFNTSMRNQKQTGHRSFLGRRCAWAGNQSEQGAFDFWVAIDIDSETPRLFELQQDPNSNSGYFVHLRPNVLDTDDMLKILAFFDEEVQEAIGDDVVSYYL